jgi:hypothetical protein
LRCLAPLCSEERLWCWAHAELIVWGRGWSSVQRQHYSIQLTQYLPMEHTVSTRTHSRYRSQWKSESETHQFNSTQLNQSLSSFFRSSVTVSSQRMCPALALCPDSPSREIRNHVGQEEHEEALQVDESLLLLSRSQPEIL